MSRTQTLPMSTVEVSEGVKARYTFFEPNEAVLRELFDNLFLNHWSDIVFGPSLDGAIFEIKFEAAPKLSYSDGYLTVDLGAWHFHLALAPGRRSTSDESHRKKCVARAALFERRGGDTRGLRSWGVRLWNGLDQQMITIWLPNASLDDERKKVLREPNWSKLALYYELRSRLFDEPVPANFEEAANQHWPQATA